MIQNLGLSKLFWMALLVCYSFLIAAMYAIVTVPDGVFETDNPEHVLAAIKLTYVRLTIVAFGLVGYPIVLLSSLKYAKYTTIALTAWAIAIYIDDYLVLYRIIEYPNRRLVVVIQTFRPVLIVCLIWMSFELTFHKPKVR
jgi:hypothetical protein